MPIRPLKMVEEETKPILDMRKECRAEPKGFLVSHPTDEAKEHAIREVIFPKPNLAQNDSQ